MKIIGIEKSIKNLESYFNLVALTDKKINKHLRKRGLEFSNNTRPEN